MIIDYEQQEMFFFADYYGGLMKANLDGSNATVRLMTSSLLFLSVLIFFFSLLINLSRPYVLADCWRCPF